MFKSILTTIVLLITATAASAGVNYDPVTRSLEVSGYTTMRQVQAANLEMRSNEVLTVILSGPGGDYYAGLALGRAIRKEGANVIIPENSTCVSACAFAALGGERVIVDGELWFHAPYLTMAPTNVTILDITHKFGIAYLDMSAYLSEQSISILLANDIIRRTSTCKFIVVDSGEEITKLRSGEFPHTHTGYNYKILDKC
jgi:hypothetical protein